MHDISKCLVVLFHIDLLCGTLFLYALKNGLVRHTGVGCVNEAQYVGCYYCYYYNRINVL